jgi:hypothetical protein
MGAFRQSFQKGQVLTAFFAACANLLKFTAH